MQRYVTANNEAHGLINQVGNSVKFDDFKNIDPKIREKAKKQKEHDHKIVKARYINYMGDHERLDKVYCRWAGDPIQTWHCIPNHVYEVPMGLVEEINNHIGLIQRSEILDSNGVPTMKDGKPKKIHEFLPCSFN